MHYKECRYWHPPPNAAEDKTFLPSKTGLYRYVQIVCGYLIDYMFYLWEIICSILKKVMMIWPYMEVWWSVYMWWCSSCPEDVLAGANGVSSGLTSLQLWAGGETDENVDSECDNCVMVVKCTWSHTSAHPLCACTHTVLFVYQLKRSLLFLNWTYSFYPLSLFFLLPLPSLSLSLSLFSCIEFHFSRHFTFCMNKVSLWRPPVVWMWLLL